MSLNTMLMAETMPATEILEEFAKLEDGQNATIARFAELVHYSYHRGCLIQMSRCIVRYMVHHNCSYEDALKVFDDPLLQGMNLKKRWKDTTQFTPSYMEAKKMDNEFSILDDYWMHMFMMNRTAANVLYHWLGGKESHKVVRCQHRCNGWGWGDEYGEIISHEMLAKDQLGINHAMTIRFIDDLSELEDIKEHPMGEIWEYQENGKDYFCRPATHMMVYFVNDTLPEDKLVCRMGFLLMPDDLDIHVEYPTQIISTVTDDGSDLAKLVQYLDSPSRNCNEFGALSRMVNVLLNIWVNRKQTEGMA